MNALVSLVVPVYNEAGSVAENLITILSAANRPGWSLELIAVDDGSQDGTVDEIQRAEQRDGRIRHLALTRNFGKEAAVHAGLAEANGDAVVVLDADLQHPPVLIPAMIDLWQHGFPVVEAVKTSRGVESLTSRLFASGFYWLFRRLAGMDLRDQSDFKLLDRAVVDCYLALPERKRFFRGLIHWTGYASARLPFEVPAETERSSRWSTLKLLRYALNNLTGFSSAPLYLVTVLGSITLSVGVVVGAISLYQKLAGEALDGFTTVNVLLVIIGGTLMIGMGIIGHYLACLYDEVKGRPSYILKPGSPHQDK